MSNVVLHSGSLKGSVTAPPSKSAAHRALICSYLAGGGTVKPIIDSNDMKATVGIIESLKNNSDILNCIESGSTMRFMIPVAAAFGRDVTFIGEGSLTVRTLGEYLELLPKHNVKVESNGFLPLKISGKLSNGRFEVAGDVSSQYITGLLLALATLDGDSAVVLTTKLQSKPYVDMTVKVMSDYGVKVFETDFGYLVHGGQSFNKIDYTVEGDWSQAAFFLVAGAMNGGVTVKGLDMNTTQGDKAILDVLKSFGARFEINGDSVTMLGGKLKGADVDATDIPDLVPIIAVLAVLSEGRTVISGAERLRYKESDRIQSVVTNLKTLGADIEETNDGMIINGGKKLNGGRLKGYNDHRIVMAFSIASLFIDDEIQIDDAESINKSYPSFFEDYNMLGGNADVL
ncbi:MAG: 3-phosphoshikimate 1-carboxyvinyltransferase [Eubacterium sp.]|nr:3-phosphoshikimate 1-carboxyvinyltransferase [Eubacterium sp.]